MKRPYVASAAGAILISVFAVMHQPAAWPHRYLVIDGPAYRETSRAEFAVLRASCAKVVVHMYPDQREYEHHCDL